MSDSEGEAVTVVEAKDVVPVAKREVSQWGKI